MIDPQSFYIVKRPSGTCEIIASEKLQDRQESQVLETWGPFESKDVAIARRVGLIRAGKCQPQ